jgi:hypothetical protein
LTPATLPPAPETAGQVLSSTNAGSVLTGGAGADTLNASQGLDTLTGGAGSDSFAFAKEPWAPVHITDFQVGTDKLDLSALLKQSGYTGSDPVKDGFVSFESDGHGGTMVGFDRDGPTGSAQVWPNRIIDLEHVSPSGLTWSDLQGPPPGQVLTAANTGAVLSGGAGADTLNASQGLDTLTGGAGADSFAFGKEPWAPVHITDFHLGEDKLDLSALLKQSGYTGADPVKDGFVSFESDGHGGTMVGFDHDGPNGSSPMWPNRIIDLEHVSPTGLTWNDLQGSGWVV